MKILVAGGGAFGKQHLQRLVAIDGIDLALAETRAVELAQLRATLPLVDTDPDAFALLERFVPDGVVIATPAAAHAPLAIAALERGVPVLVEKPVAPDVPTMRRLCAAAAASRAFLQPGHILRFSQGHQRLLDILRQGEIGDLLCFVSRRHRDERHAARYQDDPVLMTMIHDIDLALWFDGGTALSATAARRPASTARSLTTAQLESSTGVLWQLSTAWLQAAADWPADRVEIIGTRGSADLEGDSHIAVCGDTNRRVALDRADDPLRNELDCFLAGIRAAASQAPVTPEDALNGLVAAEMVLAALQQPRPAST